ASRRDGCSCGGGREGPRGRRAPPPPRARPPPPTRRGGGAGGGGAARPPGRGGPGARGPRPGPRPRPPPAPPPGAAGRQRGGRAAGRVVLPGADTGVGIPPEHLPLLFGRFSRVPGRSPEGGTGLGLAIVREIVTAHGGSITCESRPGEGATFRITLPAAPV